MECLMFSALCYMRGGTIPDELVCDLTSADVLECFWKLMAQNKTRLRIPKSFFICKTFGFSKGLILREIWDYVNYKMAVLLKHSLGASWHDTNIIQIMLLVA